MGVELLGGESVGGRDVGEAHEGVHERQLSGMVEFEAGDASAVRQDGGLGELAELPAIHEGLQDVLLDVEVVVDDGGKLGAQCGEMFDGLLDAVVGDVVGRRFGAQVEMIADVLFDKALAVVAADDRVGQTGCLR